MQTPKVTKKPRADGQLTALSGEFFVAAELLRRGFQCSVTFGNAKAIDLLVFNAISGRNFTVQVKSLRRRNFFPFRISKVNKGHIYVFVILNRIGEMPDYFVVPGDKLINDPVLFGKDINHPTLPGILPRYLENYRNGWQIFDEPVVL